MYASHVNIRALPVDYLPTWKSHVPEIGVNTFVIDDESDDEWEGSEQVVYACFIVFFSIFVGDIAD